MVAVIARGAQWGEPGLGHNVDFGTRPDAYAHAIGVAVGGSHQQGREPIAVPQRLVHSCTRLKQSLAGAPEQRAAAYTELTALAHGDAADVTTGLATATLRIGGLVGEALEDEAKLAERLGAFGTALAVTLRREAEQGSWALVTYAEAAESERALESAAAELGVESAQVRRLDTQQALGSAGAAGEAMHEQRRRARG